MPTPTARSESASTKSSTWKSPSSESMIGAASAVSIREARRTTGANLADWEAKLDSQELGIICTTSSGSSSSLPLDSSQLSMSSLVRGTQSPVRKKAQNTPIPASIPKDLRAAMLEVMLAMNATIVVTEVSMMANPTLLIALCTACSEEAPPLRSSLYLCKLCRLSSISNASISMGSRLENWDRKMNSCPVALPRTIAQPISPYIHTKERARLVPTIATSDTLLRLAQSRTMIATPIRRSR